MCSPGEEIQFEVLMSDEPKLLHISSSFVCPSSSTAVIAVVSFTFHITFLAD